MEFVFVVPRTSLFPQWTPHGIVRFDTRVRGADAEVDPALWSRDAFDACVRDTGFFVERDYAERSPALKQVIPYTVVVRRRTGASEEVLLMRRTRKGGEARLHDKLSIGVGGHVNPVDAEGQEGSRVDPTDLLTAATRREVLEEELCVRGETHLVPVGLLNDDTGPVGAVHVGLVQILDLVDGDATIREVDQLEGQFVPIDRLHELLGEGANFETWSSMLIPLLDDLLSTMPTPPRPHASPSASSSAREDHAIAHP